MYISHSQQHAVFVVHFVGLDQTRRLSTSRPASNFAVRSGSGAPNCRQAKFVANNTLWCVLLLFENFLVVG